MIGRTVETKRGMAGAAAAFVENGIDQVDEAEVVAFVSGILDDECGIDAHRRLARSVRRYFVEYHPGLEFFVVLRRNGRISAITAIDYLTSSKAIIKWFFVHPEDRNAGLGGRLLDRALCFAADTGYEKLVLGTMSRMEAAQHLYRKKGFVYRQRVTFWGRPMMVYERHFEHNKTPQASASAVPLSHKA